MSNTITVPIKLIRRSNDMKKQVSIETDVKLEIVQRFISELDNGNVKFWMEDNDPTKVQVYWQIDNIIRQ